jgi:hypothetical protein
MGINVGKLKKANEDLIQRGEGGGDFLRASKITGDTEIRILPPLPNMNDLYYFERIVYWIGNKPFISRATFGKPCVIEEEVKAARAEKDPDIIELLNDDKKFKKSYEFLVPILHLDVKFGKDGTVKSYKVINDKPTVLSCGSKLIQAITKIATSRHYQTGTDDGIADRELGYNITISKEGQGLKTTYGAVAYGPLEIENEKYYSDKAIPDVIKMTKDNLKTDEELRAIIRNFLYGEDIENGEEEEEDDRPAKKFSSSKKSAAKPVAKRKPSASEEEDEEDEDEDETKLTKAYGKKVKAKAPVDEDEDEEEEEDEEEDNSKAARLKKAKAIAKKGGRVVEDDEEEEEDEDEDDEPVAKKSVKAPVKKAAGKVSKPAKKKNLADMLDEDDDD